MTNDLTVSRAAPITPTTAERNRAPPAAAQLATAGMPNPTLRFEPNLDVVVVEFRDSAGAVTGSVPTQKQLDAYRTWDRSNGGAGLTPQDQSATATSDSISNNI